MPEPLPSAPAPATAGALVAEGVPVCRPDDRVGDVRRAMAGRRFESLDAVAVLDEGRLVGLIRLVDLVAGADEARVGALMDDDPPRIAPGADQEEVAWRAVAHGEGTMAVVGSGDRFVGLIPPHRFLEVLLREHDEDMARLGGFMAGSQSARAATLEPVRRRVAHRLPWLLLGLVGAVLAALIVDGFQDQLSENVLLAFFIPGVVYMADAVGTQTETLVIRGLSVGVGLGGFVRRELVTGVVVGTVLAAAFAAVGMLVWGDAEVIASVAVALLAACAVATTVAMALPVVLRRLGTDPAFGSGPLATVVQDLLTITIYFAVAAAVVG